MRIKSDLTLLFVSIVWGSAFVFQRIAGEQGVVYFFNAARLLLGAALLLPFMQNRTPTLHGQWRWMGIAGIVLFVGAAFQQVGIQYTTAGNAGFITSLYVVMVPFVLWIGWRERPRWQSVLAVFLSGVGAFMLSSSGRFDVQKGDALELAGALFWALHMVILGRFAFRYEPIRFAAGQFLVAGLLNLLVGIFVEQPDFSLPVVWAVVYTAIFSVGVGYTLQVWGQQHTPPTDAALILSMEAVFAVITGWIFLDEFLTFLQILGCGLILSGVLLTQWRGVNSE